MADISKTKREPLWISQHVDSSLSDLLVRSAGNGVDSVADILTQTDGFSDRTTFPLLLLFVRVFAPYAVCQQFMGELLSVFTRLQVVVRWHLGREVKQGGVRRQRMSLPVKWLLFACVNTCMHWALCVYVCTLQDRMNYRGNRDKVRCELNTFKWQEKKSFHKAKHWIMHIHMRLPDLSTGITYSESTLAALLNAHTFNIMFLLSEYLWGKPA